MKLTAAEAKLIVDKRNAEHDRKHAIVEARKRLAELTDVQALELAAGLVREYKRLTKNPGPCTCDSQWTNPKCPRVLAGWRGMNCDIAPVPVACLTVKL